MYISPPSSWRYDNSRQFSQSSFWCVSWGCGAWRVSNRCWGWGQLWVPCCWTHSSWRLKVAGSMRITRLAAACCSRSQINLQGTDWEQGFQMVPADHNSGSLIFFEDYEDSCELNIVQTFEKSEGYSIKKCKFMLVAGLYLTFVPEDKDASWAAGFHGTLEATQADHSERRGKPI